VEGGTAGRRNGGTAEGSSEGERPLSSAEPSAVPPFRRSAALVIQTAFLGDVILTTPLLTALARKHGPVDVVVTPGAAGLIEGHPAVRDVIRYDKQGRDAGMAALWRLGRRLRQRGYATAYLPHRSWRSAVLALLARVPDRTGFADSAAAITYTTRVTRAPTGHEVERLLALAGSGTRPAPPVSLGLTPKDHAAADRWLAEHTIPPGFTAIAPGSIWGTKRWPFYPALAAALDGPLVVVGGADDAALAAEIVAAAPSRAWSAAGHLTVRASAALIERARVLVANDSAPLHLRPRWARRRSPSSDRPCPSRDSAPAAPGASRWGTPASPAAPAPPTARGSVHWVIIAACGSSRSRPWRRRPSWWPERRIAVRFVLGIDIGGTNLVVGCVAEDGSSLHALASEPTQAEAGANDVVDRLVALAERCIAQARRELPGAEIVGVGAGAPGPLDTKSGIVLLTPNIGWVNMPLRQIIRDRLGLPAELDNDANCAVLGEWWVGAARGTRHAIGITIGTGIGGGLILDGRLYHGASDVAGEIGHTTIDTEGRRCKCGNYGCLEAYASGPNIAMRAIEAIEAGAETRLPGYVGGDMSRITAQTVYEAAHDGDELALEVVNDTAKFLGAGVANLLNVFNPEVVVICGGVTLAGDHLFIPLRRETARRAFKPAVAACRIVPAELVGTAGVYGAAKTFLDA
jgi:glucokinase